MNREIKQHALYEAMTDFPVLLNAIFKLMTKLSLTNSSGCFCGWQAGAVSDPKHIWIPRMLEGFFVELQPANLICQWTAFNHQIGSHRWCDMKHFILKSKIRGVRVVN